MRDPKRIEPFLDKLGEYWKRVPDWRFCQLLVDCLSWYSNKDPFYFEDEEFLELMDEYFKNAGITEGGKVE